MIAVVSLPHMSDDEPEDTVLIARDGTLVGGRANSRGMSRHNRLARRGLTLACRDAASDEQLVDWLLTIAIDGEWPEKRKKPGRPPSSPVMVAPPPGESMRRYAFEEFFRRGYGMPMQAVLVKAELEARARTLDNAADAIDVGALDAGAAGILEAVLQKALAAQAEDE